MRKEKIQLGGKKTAVRNEEMQLVKKEQCAVRKGRKAVQSTVKERSSVCTIGTRSALLYLIPSIEFFAFPTVSLASEVTVMCLPLFPSARFKHPQCCHS